ncbi:NAD-dependent epimerase/dehydratase family protein [Streptomyces sp. ME01-24h]|nr:NAD-dependent epimerase/dehydratase family protein [Streptomyces sp. ME19-03-3]MDX3352622.1 NAD-dependent epimerase/dehydratase family protein [Streptomyces sp. ME01-24h]
MTPVGPPLPWRRALVTGGAGFPGSALCERLLDAGVDVDCADRADRAPRQARVGHLADCPGFRFLPCHLASPDSPVLLDGPYDVVLHLAWPDPGECRAHPLRALEAGSDGTRQALRIAHRDGARLLFASTSEVYGDPRTHPQREDYPGNVDPVGPHSLTAESRRFAEALVTAHVAAHGADAGIVRLFSGYGPRMPAFEGHAVPTFIRQALAAEPLTITGDGSQTRCLCYVDDLVEGILAVAASRSVRPVNVGGTQEMTVTDLARSVLDLTGSRSPLRFVDRPPGEPEHLRPDTTLARELLGWQPRVSWADGLKTTIAYFAAAAGRAERPHAAAGAHDRAGGSRRPARG